MRITLDREIDVLKAAAERARRQSTPAGQRMSPLPGQSWPADRQRADRPAP